MQDSRRGNTQTWKVPHAFLLRIFVHHHCSLAAVTTHTQHVGTGVNGGLTGYWRKWITGLNRLGRRQGVETVQDERASGCGNTAGERASGCGNTAGQGVGAMHDEQSIMGRVRGE